MARPLLYKTSSELEAAIERNRGNKAELELILAELAHRKTAAARKLEKSAKAYLAQIAPMAASPAAIEAEVLYTGKYEKAHAKATRAGSPVIIGWKYKDSRFVTGTLPRSGGTTSVYAAIKRLVWEAGQAGLTGSDLATRLRHDQQGNDRSEYCQGLPPIGWAEGWIDTAVQRGLIDLIPSGSQHPAPSQDPSKATGDLFEDRVAGSLSDPGLLRAIGRPVVTKKSGRRDNLRRRLESRLRDLERAAPPSSTSHSIDSGPGKPATMNEQGLSPELRSHTEQAVAQLRAKLIDLSRRSPLISFKHGGRAASLLRIVDERPDLVYASLAKGAAGFEPLPGEDTTPKDEATDDFRIAYERARLSDTAFLEATDKLGDDERDAEGWQQAERELRARVRVLLGLPPLDYGKGIDVLALAKAHGFDTSFDLRASDGDDVAAHHLDGRLRVLQIRKELDKRLKAIWERYRSHERETGLHTLFLAYGFVEWRDQATGDAPHFAPVLLQAVTLERRPVRGRYEYTLQPHDDGLQVNVALAEKMRQHFGLEMPDLREDETPESYFVRLQLVLAKGQNLKLRRFLTLAVLPFPRMILWKDLDPAAWAAGAFANHHLLPRLLGAASMGGEPSTREPFDIDDPAWAAKAPALIRPADASQHSALIEAAEGYDLAIEGPPGTGKSETITNMIATALGQGKKVLFVAEKQAALRVVADRLRASGFGALLLELHGDSARRDEVYKGLRERIGSKTTSDLAALQRAREDLASRRDLIRSYLRLIRSPLGALGMTAYQAAWRDVALRSKLPRALRDRCLALVPIEDALSVTPAALNNMRSSFEVFAQAIAALGGTEDKRGRTRWLLAGKLPAFNQQAQLDRAREAGEAAIALHFAAHTLQAAVAITIPPPGTQIEPVLEQLVDLPDLACDDEPEVIAALREPDCARALLRQQARWRQLAAKLEQDIENPQATDAQAVERLSQALATAGTLPSSLGALKIDLARATAAADAFEKAVPVRSELDRLLNLSSNFTIGARLKLGEILVRLDAIPASAKAVLSGDLLEPLVGVGIDQEWDAARKLTVERAELETLVDENGFDTDPDELSQLADTLEHSGLLARTFGSGFRASRKRSAQILRQVTKPDAMATALRRLSSHLKKSERFQNESAAKAWFPSALWRGIDTDFSSLEQARQELEAAKRGFISIGAREVLRQWLTLSTDDRAHAASLASGLNDAWTKAVEIGFDDADPDNLSSKIALKLAESQELAYALESLRVRHDAPLERDGENLAEQLRGLIGSAEAFEALRARPLLTWIGGIEWPLDSLGRALTFVDELGGREDPTQLAAHLRAHEEPRAAYLALAAAAPGFVAAGRNWLRAESNLQVEADLAAAALVDSDAPAKEAWQMLGQALIGIANDRAGALLAADLRKYESALRDCGYGRLAQAAINGEIEGRHLADLYELSLVARLLRHYLDGDGRDLERAGGLSLAAARESFVRIDKQLHKLEADRIVAERLRETPHWGIDHGSRRHWTDMALLEHELGLTKPRTALRDVVHRAGRAMQTLKPVWMMSPASAAQYIRPGSLDFDVLVIDEASQMRPEFALSAIMRGKQFVVVGDANQLPPSDHFQTASATEDDDDDNGVDAGTESILDLANQRLRRKRRLRCAYRFQHERLINFSNRSFYENDLVVFPSPRGDDDELLGVHYIYVPSLHPDTSYEASINQREAEAVISEAYRIMIAHPEHSLGIAAMNAKQTELIQNEFERLGLERPEVRSYLERFAGTVEEFFIKNLENVQGDERDIILISTVYGPGKDGVVKQHFGLMNREVGWRRLNVLVTRAKLSTRVFSSLRPDDIKVADTTSKGPRALKDYLTYALGSATADNPFGGEPESDFEAFVSERLTAEGYEVVPQVGVDRFRIDIGVKHPDYAGGFIAGIECDGASFHSRLTVRDRDRIRQAQLESLGWHIYRIWSVDWFADPDRQTGLLLDWLARLRDSAIARLPRVAAKPPVPETMAARPDMAASLSEPSQGPELGASETVEEAVREPVGKAMPPLDGVAWYAELPGQYYTVWPDGVFVGDVTVLSRPTASAGIYNGQLRVPKPEYEGRIEATGATFKVHDIYQAVREVARRAKNA